MSPLLTSYSNFSQRCYENLFHGLKSDVRTESRDNFHELHAVVLIKIIKTNQYLTPPPTQNHSHLNFALSSVNNKNKVNIFAYSSGAVNLLLKYFNFFYLLRKFIHENTD